jgi:hypothetical protein
VTFLGLSCLSSLLELGLDRVPSLRQVVALGMTSLHFAVSLTLTLLITGSKASPFTCYEYHLKSALFRRSMPALPRFRPCVFVVFVSTWNIQIRHYRIPIILYCYYFFNRRSSFCSMPIFTSFNGCWSSSYPSYLAKSALSAVFRILIRMEPHWFGYPGIRIHIVNADPDSVARKLTKIGQ